MGRESESLRRPPDSLGTVFFFFLKKENRKTIKKGKCTWPYLIIILIPSRWNNSQLKFHLIESFAQIISHLDIGGESTDRIAIESRFRKAIKSIWKEEACPMSHHLCQSVAINTSSQLSMAVPIREGLQTPKFGWYRNLEGKRNKSIIDKVLINNLWHTWIGWYLSSSKISRKTWTQRLHQYFFGSREPVK